jgi:hypothetical protein
MEENSIRFEDIPNAITGVLKKLSSLEDKIDGIYELVQSEKEETWFTVAELCAYLSSCQLLLRRFAWFLHWYALTFCLRYICLYR